MTTDIPDLIAGALGVSRGTAYDMMREALAEAPPPDPCCWPGTSCDAQQEPLTDEQRMIEMVDSAMVATASIYPPITRSQCATIIRAAAHGINTKGSAVT